MESVFSFSQMGYHTMTYESQYVLAIEKLILHCGLSFSQIMNLQKEDFDLERKTIHCSNQKTGGYRKATIRPDDLEWFKNWLKDHTGKLFTFSERTYRYSLNRYSISSPYSLRNKLKSQMQSLNAKASLVATKLGYFVLFTEEQSTFFVMLQEFEQNLFGDNV